MASTRRTRLQRISLGALSAAILAAIGVTAATEPDSRAQARQADERDDLGAEAVAATLGDLRADPAAWVARPIRFVLQRADEIPTWQPFLTRFGPGDYVAFGAWADEAFLWERATFEDPAPYVFARRGSQPALVLSRGATYERYEVRAVVRDVFLSEPWIEVLEARPLPASVGEGTILHAVRGLELLAQGSAELAVDQLRRARAGILPEHAADELDRLIEAAHP